MQIWSGAAREGFWMSAFSDMFLSEALYIWEHHHCGYLTLWAEHLFLDPVMFNSFKYAALGCCFQLLHLSCYVAAAQLFYLLLTRQPQRETVAWDLSEQILCRGYTWITASTKPELPFWVLVNTHCDHILSPTLSFQRMWMHFQSFIN